MLINIFLSMKSDNDHKKKLNTINKGTMESLKVKDLRDIARSRGLKGWYRLRKSDLISLTHQMSDVSSKRRSENDNMSSKRWTDDNKKD